MKELYVFDPDGDVELILRNANAPFMVWSDEPVVPPRRTNEKPPTTAFEDIDPAKRKSRFKATECVHGPEEPPEEAPEEPPEEAPEKPPPDIRMRVSSKHLTLASGYFKTAFSVYRESVEGVVYAEDWDVRALEIVMNIVHGRIFSVPRSIDLEMLAKIGVLVDYYDCHEVVAHFCETWIGNLKPHVPTVYGRDLVLWLSVSWVFFQADLFKATTRVALRESCGPLNTPDLPIPQLVAGRMREESREPKKSPLHSAIEADPCPRQD